MLHDLIFEKKINVSGGTIKFKIKTLEDRWLVCARCDEIFKKHYYVHQCDPYKIYCNSCLIDKKKCKNCKTSFIKLIKNSSSRSIMI